MTIAASVLAVLDAATEPMLRWQIIAGVHRGFTECSISNTISTLIGRGRILSSRPGRSRPALYVLPSRAAWLAVALQPRRRMASSVPLCPPAPRHAAAEAIIAAGGRPLDVAMRAWAAIGRGAA